MKHFAILQLGYLQLGRISVVISALSLGLVSIGCGQNVEFAHIPTVASSIEVAGDDLDPDDPDRLPPVTPVQPEPEPVLPGPPPGAAPIPAPTPVPAPVPPVPAPAPEPIEEPTPPAPTPVPAPVPPVPAPIEEPVAPGLPEPLPAGDQVSLRGVVVSGATGRPVVNASGQCVRTGFSTHRMHPACESFETQLNLSLLNRAVFFDVDSYELTDAAKVALAQLAQDAIDNNTFINVNILGPVALKKEGGSKALEVAAKRALAVFQELRELMALGDTKTPIVNLSDSRYRTLVSCQVQSDDSSLLDCLAAPRRYSYSEYSTLTHIQEGLLIEW